MTGPCRCEPRDVERVAVLHHMPCAYVGPVYDFMPAVEGCRCPKCGIAFALPGRECEALGYALKCKGCGAEWLEDMNT